MRGRQAHLRMPVAMGASLAASLSAFVILQPRIGGAALTAWLLARLLVVALRAGFSWVVVRGWLPMDRRSMQFFRVGVVLDSVAWSSLGVLLTPLQNLEVAVVTVPLLLGVAALGGLMMQMDLPSARLYVLPITIPNAFYSLGRQDDLGMFACAAVLGTTVLLLQEVRRAHARIAELHVLRQRSEAAMAAQTDALMEARRLAETRARFVATTSHEMRTPLNGLLGVIRLARRRARTLRDDELMQQFELMRHSGDHLLRVVNEVLDFSKIEGGGLTLREEAFNLHALVGEVAETWRASCVARGLQFDLQAGLLADEVVLGDPGRLRQVLDNLISNALKFTPQGTITLQARRHPETGRVEFMVADTGVGIADEELPRIFDPFHQVEGRLQKRAGGTGLGLTIARQICLAMGGELGCTSRVGEGSRFTFALGLPPQPADALAPDSEADWAQGSDWIDALDAPGEPHVLLVEDNPVNALVAEAELRRLGLQVSIRGNGQEALDWLAHRRADLVLMDCQMPVMDGFEATQRIRQREQRLRQPRVPIIALTAEGPQAAEQRCLEAGMDGHLVKPFSPQDLAQALAGHLRQRIKLPSVDLGA